MDMLPNDDEFRRAMEVLMNRGFSLTKIGESGLYIIRHPWSKPGCFGGYKYSFRTSRFTKWDLSGNWPAGTEIARIDHLPIEWEPIFPQDKGSPAPTDTQHAEPAICPTCKGTGVEVYSDPGPNKECRVCRGTGKQQACRP